MEEGEGTKRARQRYDCIARELRDGLRHPTLGFHPNRGEDDWWKAGAERFAKMVAAFAIAPRHRVVDYGCGSLRLGGHFMRYLERGNYFGLDVAGDLIAMGRELIGEQIVADRAPHLASIDENALASAESFGAAFVVCEAVDYHVFPDELGFFYRALARLTHRPGSVLLLGVRIAYVEIEYASGCWARPLTHFEKALAPLAYVKSHFAQAGGAKHAAVTSATLEFRRTFCTGPDVA
jgi:SAM-dependent methyltransferase